MKYFVIVQNNNVIISRWFVDRVRYYEVYDFKHYNYTLYMKQEHSDSTTSPEGTIFFQQTTFSF